MPQRMHYGCITPALYVVATSARVDTAVVIPFTTTENSRYSHKTDGCRVTSWFKAPAVCLCRLSFHIVFIFTSVVDGDDGIVALIPTALVSTGAINLDFDDAYSTTVLSFVCNHWHDRS